VDIAEAKLGNTPVLVAMIHITIGFDAEILPGATSSQSAYTGQFAVEGRSDSVKFAHVYGPIWVRTRNVIEISHELTVGGACKVFRTNGCGGKLTGVVW
jgi:hypothetical protein